MNRSFVTFCLSLVALQLLSGQTVITTGLQAPQKFLLTPAGNFLVTETSTSTSSGRVSFVSRAGVRRSLIQGLPSGVEVTGGASGPTGIALSQRNLFIAIGAGDTERRGTRAGTSVFNVDGFSSPLFSSILVFRLSADVDQITGVFQITAQVQSDLSDGREVVLDAGSGVTARVSLLANLPDAAPDAVAIYRFSNPWGMAVSSDGTTLYLADASSNSLISIDTTSGKWQRVVRFGPIPNPTPVGPPMVDAVPTGVRIYDDQILVSFLSGFPFAAGNGRVMVVDPLTRTATVFIAGLTAVTDLAFRAGTNGRSEFFTIEHSLTMIATPRGPGRLLRYPTPASVLLSDRLTAPVGLAIDTATNSLFVLQLDGQIVEFKL